jgi:hypothetical protein
MVAITRTSAPFDRNHWEFCLAHNVRTTWGTHFQERRNVMIHSAEIEQVLAKAKQQRAEYIGSAARTHAGLVVAGGALSLAVMTFISESAPDAALGQQGGAQVVTQHC